MTASTTTDVEATEDREIGQQKPQRRGRSGKEVSPTAVLNTPPKAELGIEQNEVMAACREVFSHGGARDRESVLRQVAQVLGYQRLGKNIRELLEKELRTAVRRGIIQNADGELTVLCRSISEYTNDHLVSTLLTAIGNTWWVRVDAIVAAARYLGFRRNGKNIQAAFKSAINAAIRRGLIERDGPERIRKAR